MLTNLITVIKRYDFVMMTLYKWQPSLNGVKISKWRKTYVIPEYIFHFCEKFKFNQSSTFLHSSMTNRQTIDIRNLVLKL